MKRLSKKTRSGKVAVMVAVCLPTALIPLLAVGIDGGLMMEDSRRVQAGADAAALAAAAQLYTDNQNQSVISAQPTSTQGAVAAALAALDAQGFTSSACISRTVNIPATSTQSRIDGQPGTIEVIVTYRQGRAFSGLWGNSDLPVLARSVSRVRNFALGNGVILLEPLEDNALYGNGSGQLIVNEGGVVVNSSGVMAADTDGNRVVLAAKSFDITGGYDGDRFFVSPYPAGGQATPYTGTVPVPDPLGSLPEPSAADFTVQNAPNGNGNVTLQPGRYTQRLSFNGNTNVTLMPGTYYLDRGITLTGNASLQGSGVTLFNAGSGNNNINLAGTAQWSLSAPTSGTYQGVSIYQSRATASTSTTTVLTGNGGAGLTGTVYAPTTQILVTGDGTQTLGSQLIGRTLDVQGNGMFTIDFSGPKAPQPLVLQLVE